MKIDLGRLSAAIDATCLAVYCLFLGAAYVFAIHREPRQAVLGACVAGMAGSIRGLWGSVMARVERWIERKFEARDEER